jgi:hypothetical protein
VVTGSAAVTERNEHTAAWALPLWAKRIVWHLNGSVGRSIVWRIKFLKMRYAVGVGLAKRICSGNRYGVHTPSWPAYRPVGGQCLCSKVRGRLDYIPF